MAKVPQICECVQLLESWKPAYRVSGQNHDWAIKSEVFVLTALVAAVAQQKFWLLQILDSTSPLHSYIRLLVRWTQWKGPAAHPWNNNMHLLLACLMSGLELTERHYGQAVDAALLKPLQVVVRHMLAVLIEASADKDARVAYTAPKHVRGMKTEERFNHFIHWSGNECGCHLRTLTRAKRYLPVALDVSPLRAWAMHYRQACEDFWTSMRLPTGPGAPTYVCECMQAFDDFLKLC